MGSNDRLKVIAGHLAQPNENGASSPSSCTGTSKDAKGKHPGNRDLLTWNGWGFKDSKFVLNQNNIIKFTGSRYSEGGKSFPNLFDFYAQFFHADPNNTTPSQPLPDSISLPSAEINQPFLTCVKESKMLHTLDPHQRFFHGHGQAFDEIYRLRFETLERMPDIVIWPTCHKDVEEILRLAVEHNVCIIPFGGGTNVSLSLECPVTEKRMIVSLDMSEMNKVLWIDEENSVVHVEAGIIGKELEEQVRNTSCFFFVGSRLPLCAEDVI